MTVVVASVAAAVGLWRWHASRELHPSATREPDARSAHGSRPVEGAGAVQDAPAARASGHVIKMVNAGERRRELAAQIAAARARRAARAAAPSGSAAGSSADSAAMDSPEHVLTQMTSALKEVRDYVAACVKRSDAAMPGFQAELVLATVTAVTRTPYDRFGKQMVSPNSRRGPRRHPSVARATGSATVTLDRAHRPCATNQR